MDSTICKLSRFRVKCKIGIDITDISLETLLLKGLSQHIFDSKNCPMPKSKNERSQL